MNLTVNNFNDNGYQKKSLSFLGTPARALSITIRTGEDAYLQWRHVCKAKYFDVHDDKFCHSNKFIRLENYSFLDKLYFSSDKNDFIQRFCEFTGFPNLNKVSNRIKDHFIQTLRYIDYVIKENHPIVGPHKASGFDPNCSVGLGLALPCTDLDKAFVLLGTEHSDYYDKQLVEQYKGLLWDNLDPTFVSLNNPDTFPEVRTERQVRELLSELEPIVQRLIQSNPRQKTKYENLKYSKFPTEVDPYKAAKFNRDIAQELPSYRREDAKNFAFFIESLQQLFNGTRYNLNDSIFNEVKDSVFARFSNVSQIPAWNWNTKFKVKSKLENRKKLEREFPQMSTETKYDLIKDIIKSGSGDQSARFSKYFKNDDDIAERYKPLLDSLR